MLAYLRAIDQPARHDASNDDPRFTRNRIRHELLPLLARDYNRRIAGVLARLAEQAAARALLQRAELPRAGAVVILDPDVLRRAAPRTVRALLRLVWPTWCRRRRAATTCPAASGRATRGGCCKLAPQGASDPPVG